MKREYRSESGNDTYVRTGAGLVLKTHIRQSWENVKPPYRDYVKQEILTCIGDPEVAIRNTVGTVVSEIVIKIGVSSWPGLWEGLIQLLDNDDFNVVDGAFGCLYKMCRDLAFELSKDANQK